MKFTDIENLNGKSAVFVSHSKGKFHGQPGFFQEDYGDIRLVIANKSLYALSELRIIPNISISGYDFVVMGMTDVCAPKDAAEVKIWG